MGILLAAIQVLQIAVAGRASYHSFVAITNLRQYEETSKTAAKYSSTAEHQLYKTRTTQASGVVALLSSISTSIYLLYNSFNPTLTQFLFNLLNLAGTLAARAHLQDFWAEKSKVPLVGGYNRGIDNSKYLVQQLSYLMMGWAASCLITAFG